MEDGEEGFSELKQNVWREISNESSVWSCIQRQLESSVGQSNVCRNTNTETHWTVRLLSTKEPRPQHVHVCPYREDGLIMGVRGRDKHNPNQRPSLY